MEDITDKLTWDGIHAWAEQTDEVQPIGYSCSCYMSPIVCIAWKTDAMPAYSYVYYHAACYEAAKPSWPNARTLEVTTTDVAGQCVQCGKPLSQLPALSRATN